MANVEVKTFSNIEAGNRAVVRTSGNRVYVLVTSGSNVYALKGNVDGEPTSFTEVVDVLSGTAFQNIGTAIAIDSNDIIHCIYYQKDTSMGGVLALRYVTFDTNTDTFGTPENVAVLDDDGAVHDRMAIAIDADDFPHVVWKDALTSMGSTDYSFWYSNRRSGSWISRLDVLTNTTSNATAGLDIIIGDPTSSIANRPIVFVGDFSASPDYINAYYGDAISPTSWTSKTNITTPNIPVINNFSAGIDSNGKITVAYCEVSSLDLQIVEHLASSAWSSWQTPIEIDTSTNYLAPSLAVINNNRYIIVEDSTNNDLKLWKLSDTVENDYYFDGTVTDFSGHWNNDANIADGNEATSAQSTSTGEIEINGTTAPTTGNNTILLVQYRILAHRGTLAVDVDSDWLDGGTQFDSDVVTVANASPAQWTGWRSLVAPSGGWTWAKINGMEVQLSEADVDSVNIFKVEIRVKSINIEEDRTNYHDGVEPSGNGDAVWGTSASSIIDDFTTYTNQSDVNASWIPTGNLVTGNPDLDYLNYYNWARNGASHGNYYDAGGGAVLSEKFVLRFKHSVRNLVTSSNGEDTQMNFGISSALGVIWNSTTMDFVGIRQRGLGSANQLDWIYVDGTTHSAYTVIESAFVTNIPDGVTTDYWFEIARHGDKFIMSCYSASGYSDANLVSRVFFEVAGLASMRYVNISVKNTAESTTRIDGQFDDFEIWDGQTPVEQFPNVGTFNNVKVKWANYGNRLDRYYFNGTVTDNNSVWTNDSNIADGNENNGATSNTSGTSSDWIEINGTTAPTTGNTIKAVYGKVLCQPNLQNLNWEIRDGGTLLDSGAFGSGTGSKTWFDLGYITPPSGGWTWAKLNGLEIRFWNTNSNTKIVYKVDLVVSSDSNDLDYVFEDSSGTVLFNTFPISELTEVSKTYSIDSVFVKLNKSKTYTADSVFKLVNKSKTYSIDAVFKLLKSKTYSIDSVFVKLKKPKTYQADSVFKKLDISKTYGIDCVFEPAVTEVSKTYTIDSVFKLLDKSKTYGVDALFEKLDRQTTYGIDSVFKILAKQKTYSIDSVFQLVNKSKTYGADSVFKLLDKSKTYGIDTVFEKLNQSKTYSIDSQFKKLNRSTTYGIDALFRATVQEGYSIDAVFKKLGRTTTYGIDSVFEKLNISKTYAIDAVFALIKQKTYSIDAVFKLLDKSQTYGIDSVFEKLNISKTYGIDSVFKLLAKSQTYGIDSVFKLLAKSKTYGADAQFKKLDRQVTYGTDAQFKKLNISKTYGIDAVFEPVQTEVSKTYSIDAVFQLVNKSQTYGIDAVFEKLAKSKTYGIDATFKLLDKSKTYSTDAIFEKLNVSKTYAIDAVFKLIKTKTYSTDSVFKKLDRQVTYGIDAVFALPSTSKTYSIDAVFKLLDKSKTYGIDTQFKKSDIPKTYAIDAVFALIKSKTYGIDSVFKKLDKAVTYGIDAVFEKLAITEGYSIDAVFKLLNKSQTYGADAVFQLVNVSKTYGIDATFEKLNKSQTYGIDSQFKKLNRQTTYGIDSAFEKLDRTTNYTIDSVFKLLDKSQTYGADSVFKKLGKSKTYGIDAVFSAGATFKTYSIDAVFKLLDKSKTYGIDTVFQIKTSKTYAIDAVFEKLNVSKTYGIDAVFEKLAKSQTYGIDSQFKKLDRQITYGIDAVFATLSTSKTYSIDAVFSLINKQKTYGIDAVFKKLGKQTTYGIDAVFISTSSKTYGIDAVFEKLNISKTYGIDVVFVLIKSQTYGIDAQFKKLNRQVTYGIDAVFGAVQPELRRLEQSTVILENTDTILTVQENTDRTTIITDKG